MDDDTVKLMRDLLDGAKTLSRSGNTFAKVSGERIGVILVDALLELDLDMADPWDALPSTNADAR